MPQPFAVMASVVTMPLMSDEIIVSGPLKDAVRVDRLLETAIALVAAPSPTGAAGKASDRLEEILAADGFSVERPEAGHAAAPAVVARLKAAKPGPVLQFDGHLDTVHLPFVPPRVEGDLLRGSGSCDMKGGVACAIEALRVLRDTGALVSGEVMLVAHDLHEAPWGLGQQLDHLIAHGVHGDAVLIPEPLCDTLPIRGRGSAVWKARLRRAGSPVHEVMRPPGAPSVIAAAAKLVERLDRFEAELRTRIDPIAGPESVFVGQVHAGEIYNQLPVEAWLEGTRRWRPGEDRERVEREFRELCETVARAAGVAIDLEYLLVRDAYSLDEADPLVVAFQAAYADQAGAPLPTGPKAFVDDGNSFWGRAGVAAITHGPRSGGQHTLEEWVSISDMARVAGLYAEVAARYCGVSR